MPTTVTARPRTRGARHWLAVVGLAVFGVACGGGDDGTASTASPITTERPAETEPLFVRNSEAEAPETAEPAVEPSSTTAPAGSASPPDAGPSSSLPTTTLPLVPDTGVPGIDSVDPFCQSWSQFAGSFRAIGIVSGARSVDAGLRLEVMASPAVTAAIQGLGEHLPAELEPERDLLLDGFAGPFGRRAGRALEALGSAGLDDEERAILTDAWITVLSDVGIDDPSLDLETPVGVRDDVLSAAVADFVATTPAIQADPSLTTFVQIPLTDAYTTANCPDAGTLAGNDDL